MRSTAERLVEEFHMHLARIDEEVGAGQPIKSEDYGTDETERAVRQGAIAELDATNMYQQIADSVNDSKVKDLFLDIADEEKVHTGEFMKALDTLDPQDAKSEAKGEKEAAEKMGIDEALNDLHSRFPELNEAGPVLSAFQSAGKQVLSNIANKFGVQQPQPAPAAQPTQTTQQQSPNNGGGGLLSNVVSSAVNGYRNAKNQKASALSALSAAGQSGVETLNKVAQAVSTYAGGTQPAADTSTGPDAIDQPNEQAAYGDAGDGGGSNEPQAQAPAQSAAPAPVDPEAQDFLDRQGYSMKHLMRDLHQMDSLYEGKPAKQKPQDAVMNAAKNFASKIQGKDAAEWAKDDNLVKGLKAIVQGATQFKVNIPGLQGITPDIIEQAAQEAKGAPQDAGTPPAPTTDPAAAVAEIQKETPDQVAAALSQLVNKDRKALADLIQKAIQAQPNLAVALVNAANNNNAGESR